MEDEKHKYPWNAVTQLKKEIGYLEKMTKHGIFEQLRTMQKLHALRVPVVQIPVVPVVEQPALLEAFKSIKALGIAASTFRVGEDFSRQMSDIGAVGNALKALDTAQITAQVFAPLRAVNESIQQMRRTPLFAYLTTEEGRAKTQFIRDVTLGDTSEFGNHQVLQAEPELETEIVEFLQSEGGLQLSKPAHLYLFQYLRYLLWVAELYVTVIGVLQANEWLEGKLNAAKDANEVRAIVQELPHDKRELLSGYRVVTRDRLILRHSPKNGTDLGRIQLGATLEVLEQDGDWIKVSVVILGEEREGWVYRNYTVAITPPR